jgi:hypothetical protein
VKPVIFTGSENTAQPFGVPDVVGHDVIGAHANPFVLTGHKGHVAGNFSLHRPG